MAFVCSTCRPPREFANQAALDQHTAAVHFDFMRGFDPGELRAPASASAPAPMPSPTRATVLGIHAHRPARRAVSRGGCDLCGHPIDDEIHQGELVELDGIQALESHVSNSDFFDRHKDGTLCSSPDCRRAHVGADDEE